MRYRSLVQGMARHPSTRFTAILLLSVGWQTVIKGTRLAVVFILELMAAGQGESELLASYPGLPREEIRACFWYAGYLASFGPASIAPVGKMSSS